MEIKRSLSDPLMALKMLLLCEDLSGSEKRIAGVIIDHYNRKTGQCDPGMGTIARLVGVSRRTVIRAAGVLANKGYIRKLRHGGKFHRNQYEPNWAHFRAMEAQWNARRIKPGRQTGTTNLSLLERQGCHVSSDVNVTQTLTKNYLKETFVDEPAKSKPQPPNLQIVDQGLSRESKSTTSYGAAIQRFHVKSTSSQNASHDAAERRWNDSMMRQFKTAPDVFGGLIDAIDADLHRATTEKELRKPGSGLPFLLSELDRRIPLSDVAGTGVNKTTVPSGDPTSAGNSYREGSAALADFQSLNMPKQGA